MIEEFDRRELEKQHQSKIMLVSLCCDPLVTPPLTYWSLGINSSSLAH